VLGVTNDASVDVAVLAPALIASPPAAQAQAVNVAGFPSWTDSIHTR
jgi:hypothetical protein